MATEESVDQLIVLYSHMPDQVRMCRHAFGVVLDQVCVCACVRVCAHAYVVMLDQVGGCGHAGPGGWVSA